MSKLDRKHANFWTGGDRAFFQAFMMIRVINILSSFSMLMHGVAKRAQVIAAKR
jgi:hypothetical protein